MPRHLPVLVTTAHSAHEVPFDVLVAMLGDDAWDPERRARWQRELFNQNDPWTDALFQLRGAAGLHAPVSRFVVDLNRSRGDRSENGAVKRVDFGRRPLYGTGGAPSPAQEAERLERYWDPFHAAVGRHLDRARPLLLLDGHAMSPVGPVLGPDPGATRPAFNLITGGDAAGEADPAIGSGRTSLPGALARRFADALWEAFRDLLRATPAVPAEILLNEPFAVGGIQARYGGRAGVPVLSLEFNRALYLRPDLDHPAGVDVPIAGRVRELNARLQRAVEATLPATEALRDAGGWRHGAPAVERAAHG